MNSPTVFISYSHLDEVWKDQLVRQLRVLELEGAYVVWEDRQIAVGDGWRAEIETAMECARAAVLLISADFLTSEFIRGTEVPRLLQRRAKEGLRIIPLIVRPCPWRRVPWLAEIQGRPLDGRPLAEGSPVQIEKDLSALAEEIADLLQTPFPRVGGGAPLPVGGRGMGEGSGVRAHLDLGRLPIPGPLFVGRSSPAWMPPGRTRPSTSSPLSPSEAWASRRWWPAGWTAWRPTAGAGLRGCSTGRSTARGWRTGSPPPSRSSTTPSASSAIRIPRPAPCTIAAPASPR